MDGPADDVDHSEVTLDPGDLLGVEPDHPDVGHQIGEDGDLDSRLAERREDLLDVGEEHPVRAHDQHALALEREPVRIEQVGGTVQRDDRLAGAGSTLHDDDPGQLRADDLVLFHLDGGDDVGELARARLLQGRDEGAVTLDLALVEGLGRRAEELVVDAEQHAAAAGEMPAPAKTHRIAPGCAVERLGDRSSPVDDHRVAVLVGHGEAADVVALARAFDALASARLRLRVDPAEDQRQVAELQLRQPGIGPVPHHVTLEAVLVRAPRRRFHRVPQRFCDSLRFLEALVGVIEVRLLRLELGMVRHTCSCCRPLGASAPPVRKKGVQQFIAAALTAKEGCARNGCDLPDHSGGVDVVSCRP